MANINFRLGGTKNVYIPPAKLQSLGQEADRTVDRELESWKTLQRKINGIVNKANVDNIQQVAIELFQLNLVRGRGLLCKRLIQAQELAMSYTSIYAAIAAVLNSKFPDIGELLVRRLVHRFKDGFKTDNKLLCLSSTNFLALLVLQKVCHEILVFEIVTVLLESVSNDSVEIMAGFVKQVGPYLEETNPKACGLLFERCLQILHESDISLKGQFTLEALLQTRKSFGKAPLLIAELDLVEEEDQVTHYISLDEDSDPHFELDEFSRDPEFEAKESTYEEMKREILGGNSDVEEEEENEVGHAEEQAPVDIVDETGQDTINLRKVVYLTIMSSAGFEECCHKLLKLSITRKRRKDVCQVIMECCSQERVFSSFYGLLAERLCKLDPEIWAQTFEECFKDVYESIHRYETGRLRNLAIFFAFLLAADAIRWAVLRLVVLTEEDTSSSSRIFFKILILDLLQNLGLDNLTSRLLSSRGSGALTLRRIENDAAEKDYPGCMFPGMFPHNENSRHVRFAINYWTSIGLGSLTEELREYLKTCPVVKDNYFGEES